MFVFGFAESLSIAESILFWCFSAALLSSLAGLIWVTIAWLCQGVLPKVGPRDEHAIGTCIVSLVSTVSALLAMIVTIPLYSSTHVGPGSWQLLTAVPIAAVMGGGIYASALKQPRLRFIFAGLALIGFYLTLSRHLYTFSRYGVLRYLHASGLAVFLAYCCWCASKVSGRRRTTDKLRGLDAVSFAAACAVTLVLTTTMLESTSHALRVTMFERTALVHRAMTISSNVAIGSQGGFEQLESACERLPQRDETNLVNTVSSSKVRGVLVVLVDSLRFDRIGRVRDGVCIAPRLQELAERSVVFTNAFTNYPGTELSVQAMATGRYAQTRRQQAEFVGFGDRLAAVGVEVRAVIAHENIRQALGGSVQYDDTYIEQNTVGGKNAKTSPGVAQATLEALKGLRDGGGQFVLVSHFYDPHAHYVGNDLVHFGVSEEARYDAEVHYADHWIGWMLDNADNARLLDDVAIVVVSDHGEEFWDHRYKRHQFRLYDESVRLVLMMSVPGLQSGRRVDMAVSSVDLLPTLLELLAVSSRPGEQFDGVSLMPWLEGDPPSVQRPVFMSSANGAKLGVVHKGSKLILNRELPALELYDLTNDPGEQQNLADRGNVQEMFCLISAWAKGAGLW